MKKPEIEISEVQIIPVKPVNGLVAFASFIINSQFYVGDIAVYTSPTCSVGFRLVYPMKTLSNGKRVQCFHPINADAGAVLTEAVVSKFVQLMRVAHRDI